MNLDSDSLRVLKQAADLLAAEFDELAPAGANFHNGPVETILNQVATRLGDNFPYHHPFYLGQMLKPPHPVAQLAYTLAMCINPNNHALDGGRASSEMEKDAVGQIAAMIGWKNALGHLCGGGTVANLEALWVAREFTSGKAIAVSQQAHYTHARCASLLGMDCIQVSHDSQGRMSLDHLEDLVKSHNIGTVVATLGTTGLGAVDPLDGILELQKQFGFRIHVDAAYGGYFRLASQLSEQVARQYVLMKQVDSVVIDPHKHGLQPYGCGCVLFKDPIVAKVYKHDSPYTYFTSDQLHLGEISLECSRPGASAVALWATLKRFPLKQSGEFAQRLDASRSAAVKLFEWLDANPLFIPVTEPDLDILVWSVRHHSASEASVAARRIFQQAAESNLHLALLTVPRSIVEASPHQIENWDDSKVVCLRACLMKPEHNEWMPRILTALEAVCDDEGSSAISRPS